MLLGTHQQLTALVLHPLAHHTLHPHIQVVHTQAQFTNPHIHSRLTIHHRLLTIQLLRLAMVAPAAATVEAATKPQQQLQPQQQPLSLSQ